MRKPCRKQYNLVGNSPPARSSLFPGFNMRLYTTSLMPLACLLLCLTIAPALAQDGPLPEDEQSVGMIKGTDMFKNEFRALAYTQMLAVALNAHAYYLEYNEYPSSFYDLYNSGAWNLDIQNIFSGAPVNEILYDADSVGRTNLPSLGLMTELKPLDTSVALPPPTGPFNADNPIIEPLVVNSGPLRIDPAGITAPAPGDVLYFTEGNLLQLVIFAPDGTYVEYVSSSPDRRWLSTMGLNANDYDWPWDVYSAEVLLFTEELLPQYYSLYRYMSNQEDIPRHRLAAYSAQQRIDMAAELKIGIWNPYTKAAIEATELPSRGNFLEEPGAPPTPLLICLDAGRLLSLEDAIHSVGNAPGTSNPIFGEASGSDKKEAKPKRKSKHGSFGGG